MGEPGDPRTLVVIPHLMPEGQGPHDDPSGIGYTHVGPVLEDGYSHVDRSPGAGRMFTAHSTLITLLTQMLCHSGHTCKKKLDDVLWVGSLDIKGCFQVRSGNCEFATGQELGASPGCAMVTATPWPNSSEPWEHMQ